MTTHTETTHTDLALGLVCVALGLESGSEVMTLDQIPGDATFSVRRDVEYLAEEDCHPNYASPQDTEQMGWMRTGDEKVLESDWSGTDQMVRSYRWDLYRVDLETLGLLAYQNLWDGGHAETLMGYLESDGLHPSCSMTSGGEEWNQGMWTPVYIVSDYVVLD